MSKFEDLCAMNKEDADDIFTAEEEATVTVYGLRPGDTLTQADFDAIQLFDKMARDEADHAVNTFHRGYQSGLRRGAGADTAKLIEERDSARSSASLANAMRTSGEYHAFRRGAQACREMMARFVEQGGDTVTAESIRANWHPDWGSNPERPDELPEIPAISARPLAPTTPERGA